MTPGPGHRKCTPYLWPGPGGMPLWLRLSEGLGRRQPRCVQAKPCGRVVCSAAASAGFASLSRAGSAVAAAPPRTDSTFALVGASAPTQIVFSGMWRASASSLMRAPHWPEDPTGLCMSEIGGLTFELRRTQRWDARPGMTKMYRVPAARAWWPAVGARLERGVRPHWGAVDWRAW